MIVVDVGCHTWPGLGRLSGAEESVHKLITRFEPMILFGFDPHPDVEEGPYVDPLTMTRVVIRRAAAWHESAAVWIVVDGDRTAAPRLRPDSEPVFVQSVEGINLPAFIDALPEPVVLKLDCEGAEYPLLHEIRRQGLDQKLELVLVEWHTGKKPDGDYYGHGWAELGKPRLRCPVEEW